MKVVAFLGSPRRGGNTEILLDAALSGVKEAGGEAVKIVLNELSMRPCQGCGACHETGVCRIEDDFQEVYRLLRDESQFVFASPVYFTGVSAQAKIMIDRCQCCWAACFILNRPLAEKSPERRGIILGVCAMQGEGAFSAFLSEARAFFASNNIKRAGELLVSGVDQKGDIREHPEVLEEANVLGYSLAQPFLPS